MKKKSVSFAASLLHKGQSELVQMLQEAYRKIAELQRRNVVLEREASKYKTQAAQQRQRAKSLSGRLKAQQAKVETIRSVMKSQKNKIKAAVKKAKKAEAELKELKLSFGRIKPTLTKEQLFELYKSSDQNRFWERMTSVHQFDAQRLAEMQAKMSTWSSQKLRDIIRVAGWRSTWYDSDAEWNASEVAGWDERNLYAFIMSY